MSKNYRSGAIITSDRVIATGTEIVVEATSVEVVSGEDPHLKVRGRREDGSDVVVEMTVSDAWRALDMFVREVSVYEVYLRRYLEVASTDRVVPTDSRMMGCVLVINDARLLAVRALAEAHAKAGAPPACRAEVEEFARQAGG